MDIEKATKDIQKQLKRLGGPRHLEKRLEWLQPFPIGVRADAILEIQKKGWTELSRKAGEYRSDALGDLDEIVRQQQEWVELWKDVESLRQEMKNLWKPPKELSEWPDLRGQVLTRLLESGSNQAEAEAGVAAFGKASVRDILEPIDILLDQWARQLEVGAAYRFSALAAADIATAVAQFNLNYEAPAPPKKPEKNVVRKAETEIVNLLRSIYEALRTGDQPDFLTKAHRAEERANELLGPLLEAAAYWAHQSEGETDADIGRNAIQVANAIRSALFTLSSARVVIWKAGWPEGSPFLDSWLEAAKEKHFESAFVAPQVTPLDDIARAPEDFNGKFISIEGRIGPVAIVHRGRKVISSTSVSDANGAVVRAGLPYIKLDSGGLVLGSYARLIGTYTTSNNDFDTPVLVLDRRNLTEDSRQSWLDWLALELLPVITPTPHGLSVEWSWAPGPNGPGNLLRYGTWAKSSLRRNV